MIRFGCDVDGVLFDFEGSARFLIEKHTGHKLEVSDEWNSMPKQLSAIGASHAWDWLWQREGGLREGLFRHGNVLRGALAGVHAVAEHCEMVALTSRPKAAADDTYLWFGVHGLPFTEVHILGSGVAKSSVIPWCDVYLDDNEDNCLDLVRNVPGATVLLWKQPWNDFSRIRFKVEPSTSRLFCVSSWDEVLEHVKGVKG